MPRGARETTAECLPLPPSLAATVVLKLRSRLEIMRTPADAWAAVGAWAAAAAPDLGWEGEGGRGTMKAQGAAVEAPQPIVGIAEEGKGARGC